VSSLGLPYSVGEHIQLSPIEHRAVDHADQDLIERAVAEPIDNMFDRPSGNPAARLGCVIDERPAIDRVAHLPLLFKPPQNGSHCRILEASRPTLRQQLAEGVRRQVIVAPHLTPPETTAQGIELFALCEKKETPFYGAQAPLPTQVK
jgi:hypothetical protein